MRQNLPISDRDREWAHKPQLDTYGCKLMIGQMLADAVNEYRTLAEYGLIIGDQVNKESPRLCNRNGIVEIKGRPLGYRTVPELKRLLNFFRPGGAMDRWILLAHLKTSGDFLRRTIGYV